jgi:hypothetical protein
LGGWSLTAVKCVSGARPDAGPCGAVFHGEDGVIEGLQDKRGT